MNKTARAARMLLVTLAVGSAIATTAAAQPAVDFAKAKIEVLPVRGNVYMLAGPVGNSAVQVGDDGVLVVDTQFAELSDKILAAIHTLSSKPLRYVVNTHAHADHTGGNEPIARAGITITGGNVAFALFNADKGAAVIAHENVLLSMTQRKPPAANGALPTDTYFTDQKDLYFNGEPVLLLYQPAAHTNGDTVVHFRGSDVIVAGDVFVTTTYPVIDEAAGGNIEGIIAALNRIIKIAVPADKAEGGTLIVPGHGRLCDEADVVHYRDMVTIIRDRIAAMIKQGMTLAQVQAARPTLDYDGRYGATSGLWTTEQFVAAAYRNLGGRGK
jgi:glyoxylase-like metal-dependent hydrolase (beta-lactamase superfamily II)